MSFGSGLPGSDHFRKRCLELPETFLYHVGDVDIRCQALAHLAADEQALGYLGPEIISGRPHPGAEGENQQPHHYRCRFVGQVVEDTLKGLLDVPKR